MSCTAIITCRITAPSSTSRASHSSPPSDWRKCAYALYFSALSIASSRKRLWVETSYFVLDDDFRRLLLQAARRGVDVRIITAGDKSDVKTTTFAGRARYEELLAGGVRIYEYRAPTIIVAAPATGSTLPDDKPVAVFRFMTNEPLDPIDALTFSVSVDGKDRTSLFQLAQSEAWGRLAELDCSLADVRDELMIRREGERRDTGPSG